VFVFKQSDARQRGAKKQIRACRRPEPFDANHIADPYAAYQWSRRSESRVVTFSMKNKDLRHPCDASRIHALSQIAGGDGSWVLTGHRYEDAMTKSELIEAIALKQAQLSTKDVELAVKTIIEHMSQSLSSGGRIEIRGFGSFSLHYREPRRGRNPKTGDTVELQGKYVPHFKPGKELRDRVNLGLQAGL
jgi:integration host factor subunit beta